MCNSNEDEMKNTPINGKNKFIDWKYVCKHK